MRLQYAVAQTFTHWTYEHTLERTGSALMVCDLQGVKYRYTDVTLCSEDRRFGKTDLGEPGFLEFFKTHRCNKFCTEFGLTAVADAQGGGGSAVTPESTATSAIQLIRTKHLSKRKRDREIETREMQSALKHGRKDLGSRPGSVKHTLGGLSVVTDEKHRVGITAFRKPHDLFLQK
jgi:hypothetical protein